jgi:sugar phosphate isomerase/epimerase
VNTRVRLGDELMLCNVSVASLPLQDVIPAAAAAGFTHISVLARSHRRAIERDGVTNADLRALLRDHAIRVQEVEAIGDWLSPPPTAAHAWMDPVYDCTQLLRLADELDAPTIVATHFGAPAALDVAAEAFARLCDRAGESGRRIALEFPAMATIADVTTAWDVVRRADRANGGILVDNWHHDRSVATDDALDAVPPERIFSVQLSDASAVPIGPPLEDVVHRVLPGDGELEIARWVERLADRGVQCPIGIEVLRREIVEQGAVAAARALYVSLQRAVRGGQP